MKNKKVLIAISSCAECGYLTRGCWYSLDGLMGNQGQDWYCEKSKKLIHRCVESEKEGKEFGIPESCKLRVI